MKRSRVCVIGAGVVGCATAYRLAKSGHAVVLLDRQSGPGLGTSFANGAQLSYSYVEPLATPATLRKIPAMLLDPDSPLHFKFTGEMAQINWGLQFLRACRTTQVKRATAALLALSFLSRDELEAARLQDQLEFEYARIGKLVIYDNDAALESAARQMEYQRSLGLGCEQFLLTREECLRRDSALLPYARHIRGGVWTPGEAVGNTYLLCLALMKQISALGGQCVFDVEAIDFVRSDKRITQVVTRHGVIEADWFVLASGVEARGLGRKLGIHLPIYPIKGYSITLPITQVAQAPMVSVTDLRRKIVYAPLNGRLRIAGMAELVGHNTVIDERRIDFLTRCVQEIFPGACAKDIDPQPWAGLRPATPTSMPVIGRARYENFLVNAGYGALGLTLAMGGARLIEQQINGIPDVYLHAMAQPFVYHA